MKAMAEMTPDSLHFGYRLLAIGYAKLSAIGYAKLSAIGYAKLD